MSEVTLNMIELNAAATCGVWRRLISLKQNNNALKHTKNSNWSTDIDGAAAELAFAKLMGLPWLPTVNTFKAPDIGSIQVRSTNYKSGHLIVRPNDGKDEMFVLMVGSYGNWTAAGWVYGWQAMTDKYWRESEDGEASCWWVPQSDLKNIKHLSGHDILEAAE